MSEWIRVNPNGTRVRTIPATVQRFSPQRDMPLIARWRIYAAQDDAGVLQALFNIATGEEIFI